MIKIPVEWLKEYVNISLPSPKLADKLTMAGMEVASIDKSESGDVFSLEITPNRADCLSIIGLAREVAAITGAKLSLPKVEGKGEGGRGKGKIKKPPLPVIQIEDRKDCPLYIGRLIGSVKIGPSPEWMKKRLLACGLRPINNVVDITNYVLLECGQPLHAFDNKKLAEGKIIVRRARQGEAIVTIDEESRALSSGVLVIADAKKPVAVAGVMGGKETEVSESTAEVLLESALFNPIIVRRSSRALGLSSESSYRFERGIDPEGVEWASVRAAEFICKLAGGRLISVAQAGSKDARRTSVMLDLDQIEKHLGVGVSKSIAKQGLNRLGFSVREKGKSFLVEAASFRKDISHYVDLIEDIARLQGYENFPESLPSAKLGLSNFEGNKSYFQVYELRRLLASLGLNEVMNWALVSESEVQKIGLSQENSKFLFLSNPLSQDHAILRPNLLVGMLYSLSKNAAHGSAGAKLFEIGHVFEGGSPPKEKLNLAIGITGAWSNDWQSRRESSLFVLKGILEEIIKRLCGKKPETMNCELQWAEPGECMQLRADGKIIAHAGRIKKSICEDANLEHPAWFAQICPDFILLSASINKEVQAPSAFPPVKRDISFTIDKSVAFSEIESLIRQRGSPLINKAELIDRYTGKQISADKHSLTFSIEYRDPSRTLTSDEVDVLHQKISQALAVQFKAQLR